MKKNFFLNEKTMLCIVLLNVAVIFLQGCGMENPIMSLLDISCTLIFVVEMIVKHKVYGIKKYWHDGWNVLDGVVTIVSLPALLIYFMPALGGIKILVAFRALRVFKLFRTARHFPHLAEIWNGFKLALRQSAAFLLAYFVIIVVIAMFNSALFGHSAPEYFATPLDALYSVFQLFTIEGWYEIPNAVVGHMQPVWVHVIRTYFCLLLIGGGIIGMSLINSIFVDAMAADNNDDVMEKLKSIEKQLSDSQNSFSEQIAELRKLLDKEQ
ncbi:MAG: ion transporter [Bacteroidales bacterium]|nr:ion transporter [Bacteroidales bacterium]